MRRICVVVTARPSYARIQTALQAIALNPALELQLVVSGSALLFRYGEAIRRIKDDFEVVAELPTVIEGDHPTSMGATTAQALQLLTHTFSSLRPHIVVTIADRYETLATAIAASYQNIPLAHVQGGEVTGSIDEKVRHSVTKLADLHFVATEQARDRVLGLGERLEAVHVTGCPSIDIAAHVQRTYTRKFYPWERYGGVGQRFNVEDGYLVILQHPVTTHAEKARTEMMETLIAARRTGLPAFIFWPNVDTGTDAISKLLREWRTSVYGTDGPPWHFFRHMEAEDFLRLLLGAEALLGNSSVGIRECSFLGVPVVNIGDRQAGRERGPNVIDTPYRASDIEAALALHAERGRPEGVSLYGNGTAGPQIADLLATSPLTVEKRLVA